jgi:hypothetical protein
LPTHTIFRSRTEIGDQLRIDRYEAKPTMSKSPGAKSEDEICDLASLNC